MSPCVRRGVRTQPQEDPHDVVARLPEEVRRDARIYPARHGAKDPCHGRDLKRPESPFPLEKEIFPLTLPGVQALDVVTICTLLLANAVFALLVAMSLPGTWLILAATCTVAWLRWDEGIYGLTSLGVLAGLAALGEVLELVTGALGAKKAGGSTRGAVGAMAGGVAGGILGTFFLPIPILGSILGAALGAFGGALLGERTAGRDLEAAAAVGRGAFVGRLLGTLSKLLIAGTMWIVVAFASFL